MTLVSPAAARPLLPGVALASAVSIAAVFAEPLVRTASGGRLALPGMVIALIVGIALHGLAARPLFEPGLTFAVKKLLRWAIGLLGLRVALGDIVGLGAGTLVLVVAAMAVTITTGIWLARRVGAHDGYGALAGAATAVCGASAALAPPRCCRTTRRAPPTPPSPSSRPMRCRRWSCWPIRRSPS